MEEIQCEILCGEYLFKSYYYFNAGIIKGSLTSSVGMWTEGIRINGRRLNKPVSFVKLSTGPQEQMKLYVDLQVCSEEERGLIEGTSSGIIGMELPDRTVSLQGNKHLLFADQSGILQIFPVLLALARLGGQIEVYSLQHIDKASLHSLRGYLQRMGYPLRTVRGSGEKSLIKILGNQKIGTRILAFCEWAELAHVKRIARQAGFSNEEMQEYGYGNKEERVFCAKCYGMQLKPRDMEMACVKCGTPLIISNHYSRRLEAYLGYVNVN